MNNDKLKATIEILEQGIKELITSERWTSYLKFQNKFYQYSFCNSLLILLQRPTATKVMGYRKWEEVGRHVKKGERGIAILAPLFKKIKAIKENGNGDEEEITRDKLCGFKTAYVFDIEQTEGEPVPEEIYRRTEGNSGEWLLNHLVKVGQKLGYKVLFEGAGTADGYCDQLRKTIVVDPVHEINHQTSVLAHELGHALLHESSEMTREDKEFEAESVSFCVLYHFGLNTQSYSFPYIAAWQHGELDECVKKFTSNCERINKTAKQIIEMIENVELREEV